MVLRWKKNIFSASLILSRCNTSLHFNSLKDFWPFLIAQLVSMGARFISPFLPLCAFRRVYSDQMFGGKKNYFAAGRMSPCFFLCVTLEKFKFLQWYVQTEKLFGLKRSKNRIEFSLRAVRDLQRIFPVKVSHQCWRSLLFHSPENI